jgi:DNA repair exonuclease SbcCD nuclease subunit
MTRVIHTGDTHLGYRQYHEPARRQDFLDAFGRVVDDAVDAEVDAVVHAGDLFHDRRPDLPDLMGTLSVLRTLDDAGIPFLAIVGNHETKRSAQWLDLFESLGLATRLDDEPTLVGETAFYGLDYVPRSRRDGLEYAFEPHEADHAALVAHGLFQPFEFGEWDAAEVLTEASVEFDAMLLGDNHDPGTKQVEGAWVTYCGSTERASADEREDRGYNIVEFDGEVSISRRGIPTREFVFVDVDLREDEGIERVRERVGQHGLAEAVVIVNVDGEGEPVTPARVEEFAAEQGALVARVTDHRERAEEREVAVSFADPDEAVRERVRELGLSTAARDLDETIRASKVADSNVTETVEERVRDLLEEGDASAFEPAPPEAPETAADRSSEDEADSDAENVATGEAATGDGNATDDGDATDTADPTGGEGAAVEDDGADEGSGSHEGGPADPPSDEDAAEPAEGADPATAVAEAGSDGSDAGTEGTDGDEASTDESPGSDGQSSMEEFL